MVTQFDTATPPRDILNTSFQRASSNTLRSIIDDTDVIDRVGYICRFPTNRACVRLLLACLLAKVHNSKVDIRKPYTAIGDRDSYSGRTYDESYIGPFVIEHYLPCNNTTAFLTPSFRNTNAILTPEVHLVGRPQQLFQTTLDLLNDVQEEKVSAEDLLALTVRWLLISRDEQKMRLGSGFMSDPSPAIEKIAQAEPSNIQTIAASHLEIGNSYYTNMLLQSQQSFQWALIAAGVGLLFFFLAVIFLLVRQPANLSYISVIGGIVVEVIAGVNFALYGRASEQAAAYHVRLDRLQRFLVANSACENISGDRRDSTRAEIVKMLVTLPDDRHDEGKK